MFKCAVCRKAKVPDKGFKAFITYSYKMIWPAKDKKTLPTKGRTTQQIRICPKCLKKRSVEIVLD
jgi:hypothetical protein